MNLCAQGLELHRLLSERNRPTASSMRERQEAATRAVREYQEHVSRCPQCGARMEAAA